MSDDHRQRHPAWYDELDARKSDVELYEGIVEDLEQDLFNSRDILRINQREVKRWEEKIAESLEQEPTA